MSITKDIIEAEFRTSGGSKTQKDIAEVQKSIALVNNENERLRVTKAKLEEQNKKGTKGWKAVNDKIKANNKLLTSNKGKLKVLNSQLKVTEMNGKQLSNRMHELKRQMAGVNKEVTPDRWNRLQKELKETERQMTKVQGRTNGAQKSMMGIKGIATTFLPAASAAAFLSVLKSAGVELFNLTKQMQGDAVRSATVFGDQLGYVEEQSGKVAAQMGLTNREFVANAAATADLLIPLEFTREESAKMSVELQKLTGAMDEWTGGSIGAAEVSNILTKAMLGENEQLKQLGIAIRKDSDEFRDLVKIKMEAGDVTKAQAEAMATLELITTKSADAQAAYNQEGNKLLRTQKSISVWWKNMKESAVEYFAETEAEQLQEQQQRVNNLTVALYENNLKAEDRKRIVKELTVLAPDIVASLDAEGKATDKTREALEKYNDQMIQKIFLATKQAEVDKINEAIAKRSADLFSSEIRLRERINELQKKNTKGMGEDIKAIQESGMSVLEQAAAIEKLGLSITKTSTAFSGGGGVAGGAGARSSTETDYTGQVEYYQGLISEKQGELQGLLTQMEESRKWFEQQFGTSVDGSGESSDGGQGTGRTVNFKQLKVVDIKEEDIEAEMEKANDKIIEEYLKGQDKLKAIQEQYGLADAQSVNEQALAAVQDLYDKQLISKRELEEAKKAIEADSLQQSIEMQLQYKMLQEENRLLDLETEQLNYEERLIAEQERYEAALVLEDERYNLEIEKAQGQKDLLLEMEIEHKNRLIDAEGVYTARKSSLIDKQNAMEQARLQVADAVVGGIITVLGQESEVGKALLVVKQGIALAGATMDLAAGLSKSAAAAPFPANAPLIAGFIGQTAGLIATIKNATKSVPQSKNLGSRRSGGYGETGFNDDEVKGLYHANEFIGNADSVRNPSVSAAYDIIDVAQKAGTISTLNLPAAIAASSQASTSASLVSDDTPADSTITANMMTVIAQNTATMDYLIKHGVKGVWNHTEWQEGDDEMNDIIEDASM